MIAYQQIFRRKCKLRSLLYNGEVILSMDSFHLVAVNSDHLTTLDSCLIREISQLVTINKNTLCTPVNAFVDIETYLAYVETLSR